MLNPSSLLSLLLPCCARTKSDATSVRALLDRENIGILSAACCDATASEKDEEVKTNLQAALQRSGDGRQVVFETITAAQSHLRTLEAEADDSQKRLITSVMSLFQTHGLGIFPVLIVDGRVAFYGGVPSVEMIVNRLKKQPLSTLSM